MSETITKNKKKVDYELLRKLEDEYDDAVEDSERKEKRLIEKVHEEYLKAENKTNFFKELHHGENWYKERFEKYGLPLQFASKSDAMKQVHAERKVDSIIDDLEEMENEIPIIEIDENLKEGTDYKDPNELKKEWIEKTKQELQSEEPEIILGDSHFGTYQATKQMLIKPRDLSKYNFDVGDKYKNILIHQLKKTIEYLKKLLEEIE